MQYLSVICLVFLILDCLTNTVSPLSSEPYCNNNITETTHKIVTKTRVKTVIKKGFFNKKKVTQIETYEDYEPVHKVKLVLDCCEGYALNAFKVCAPQCIENGCPANSRCVEPEVCECRKGYVSRRSEKDGKHICEPICDIDCPEHSECVGPNKCACKQGYKVTEENQCKPYCVSDCPHGGVCVAPNACECSKGYRAQQGTCVDVCKHCENGSCLDENVCTCNDGFKWNSELFKCESIDNENNWETSTYYPESTVVAYDSADTGIALETDIETDRDDIDPNEVFDEIIPTTTYDPLDDSSTHQAGDENKLKCPDDYVYHKGQCHPLKFASNDIDCRFKPCEDEHAICLENGTCACKEGFIWFKMHVVDHDSLNHSIKAVCLTTMEYANRLQQQQADMEEENINDSSSSWSTIFFIVLGVLVMLSALVFLGFKLLRTQTGSLDVEGKNLSCSYDSRACLESGKSVI